jgi:hypothetical protein
MKTSKKVYQLMEKSENAGFEFLNDFEMFKIRGGGDADKIKTKEIDVYDVRED